MKLKLFTLKSFTIPILLVMLFIAGCAGATSGSSPSSGANEVFAKIVTLQFLVDLGVLPGAIDPMEGFTRFMLLILLFALLFRVLDHLIGRGTAIAVSLVVSLMTVIFIPGTILLMIATSYGTLFSVILLLVPIGLGVAAHWFLKEHPFIRAVLMGAIAFLLYALMKYIESWTTGASTEYDSVINAVSGWINIVFWAVIVLAVWNFFAGIHSGATGHSGEYSSSPKRLVDIGKKIGDLGGRFGKWGFKKIKNRGANTVKAALIENIEDEKMFKLLGDVEEKINSFGEHYDELIQIGGFKNSSDHFKVNDLLTQVWVAIQAAEDEIRPLFKTSKRAAKKEAKFAKAETKLFGEALQENLENLGTKLEKGKQDLEKLKKLEEAVLTNHQVCKNNLDAALDIFKKPEQNFKWAKDWYSQQREAYYFPYSFKNGYQVNGSDQHPDRQPFNTGGKDLFLVALSYLVFNVKNKIKPKIDAAKKAEEEAKKMLEGVVAETKELLA